MIDVAILGATGTVGQKFIILLDKHPNFKVKELVASEKSAGKSYEEACLWKQAIPIPKVIAGLKVKANNDELKSKILFSGLDSSVASEVEIFYAKKGHIIISNTKNYRMAEDVPLVIPEVNHEHLDAIKKQRYSGAIVTNPNCSTIASTLALAPLHKEFGISKLIIHTMQAISGAGYPGVASMDILGNVIPFIDGEEEKIPKETNKILGSYTTNKGFESANIIISAHCNRVPVWDGHTENISVLFKKKPSQKQIIELWQEYKSYPQKQKLHSAPTNPIWYLPYRNRPQPLIDLWNDKGMASTVGNLRDCEVLDYKFTVLGHNTIRGAAGAAILNAETMLAKKLIK